MGSKIGFILILIVGAGLVLYVVQSGVIDKGAQGFSSLFTRSTTTLTPSQSEFTGPVFGGNGPSNSGGGGGSGTSTPVQSVNPSDIPPGFTAAQLSPYFHEIRFSGLSYGNPGFIGLSIALPQGESVDITGWQIKSRASGEFIPQAINIYDPSGLTPESDIKVKAGDWVNIYSSSAPVNLRLNKCMGYIAHFANFNPPLPVSCPSPDYAALQKSNLSGRCLNAIYSVGGCSQPDFSNPNIPQNEPACIDYLKTHFTYRTCFDEHISDSDFLSGQVMIWTGANVIDQYHDKVQLLDKNGLLVDYSQY